MTAAAMREDREACRAAGMDDYLSKPLQLEELEACLARAVEARGAAHDGSTVDESVLDALAALGEPGSAAVDEVIDIFLANTPARLAAMRRSLESGNFAELDHLNHALRGVASALGARAMCEVCAQIQERIRAGSPREPLAPFVDRLEQELQRVHQALAAWRRPVA
jgi:HPt (histidine-containing phosphotransfer) domain-containing protein